MDEQLKSVSVELYKEILSRGEDLEITVGGSSMWPFIKDGEALVVRKVTPEDIIAGDVIATYADQRLLCHRVFKRRGNYVQTKADALVGFDAQVSYQAVLGKVIARRCNGHLKRCDSRLSVLKGKCILWFSFLWAPSIPILRRLKSIVAH